jgi:hypothetical protein
VYLLLCIVIFVFRKSMIINPIANLLIKAMTSDDKSDNE